MDSFSAYCVIFLPVFAGRTGRKSLFDKDVPQNGKRRFQEGLFFHGIRVEIFRFNRLVFLRVTHQVDDERHQACSLLPFKAPPRIREGGKFPKRQGVGIDSGDSGETEDEIVKRSRA